MEQDKNIINPEIVEDMPDFEQNTAEMPCEGEESVTECTDVPENENVSEENTEESADTEGETEEKEEDKKEDKPKKATFKSNLPEGFSFNPLVIAIKPFYDALIAEDETFARIVKERESRAEKPKSLAECADYIVSEAYNYAKDHKQGQMGMAGFPDEDMPRLIQHYYNEEFLEVVKFTDARASFMKTAPTPAKTAKKTAEKPKPVKNVLDITKAIKSATDGTNREKKKDSLKAGFVPMERPATLKDAKKGSREQAKSVETIDMFADFFASEE